MSTQAQSLTDVFASETVTEAPTRYTLAGTPAPSPSKGIVAVGVMTGKQGAAPQLVHTGIPGRQEQAIDLAAVRSAIVHGAIPYATLVKAFDVAGKLEALQKALAAHK